MKRNKPVAFMAVFFGIILLFGAFPAVSGAGAVTTYTFDSSPGPDWSTAYTVRIGNGKALGLFNDRNSDYTRGTHLNLKNLPSGKNVTVAFDLILIGSWDSGGKEADRWTLKTKDGKLLLDLTRFPFSYQDKEQKSPVGTSGTVYVDKRPLEYWVVPQQVTVTADKIVGGNLSLEFRGQVTGRSTEFWALDNVTVKVDE